MNDARAEVTVDLLKKYDRPGPRYTSYPTAVEFHERFDAAAYRRKLAEADGASSEPLSFYIHLPFCHERCSFCGCHVVIARDHAISQKYLDHLHAEIDLLAERLPNRRRVSQYHWGGGTPTYQTVDEMAALQERFARHFRLDPDAEVAIEVDPRVTSPEQIRLLRELGFNRISMGVQDFTPEVQEAINRNQSEEETRRLFDLCRRVGFPSINLDLIYGLPLQTPERFRKNMDTVLALRPERVALYSYAYVPWVKANQKRIVVDDLPSPEAKLQLFILARNMFLEAGYVGIGMDHFALPGDEMATAASARRLHRNFMGYTVRMGSDMVGVGVSAIGDVRGAFSQNCKKLSTYYEAVSRGELPIERGYLLDDDDRIRRDVISGIMCNFWCDRREIASRWGIDFDAYFAEELEELAAPDGPVSHGFVKLPADGIEIVGNGRLFVRNVAMIFDRYLKTKRGEKPIFSRTV
jgi:oxygen-independent coproporphyrinogen-3 oxidase